MATCYWHPKRKTDIRCDSCDKPMCTECSTQLAKKPESYRLCPECLKSLEKAVDMGFEEETKDVPVFKTWVGALAGGGFILLLWFAALIINEPPWYVLITWMGTVFCAFTAAAAALVASGRRRGRNVMIPAVAITVLCITSGYYLTMNAITHYVVTQEMQTVQTTPVDADSSSTAVQQTEPVPVESIRAANEADYSYWQPAGTVFYVIGEFVTWRDWIVIAVALFLVHALTHRRRLWRSHANRPMKKKTGTG